MSEVPNEHPVGGNHMAYEHPQGRFGDVSIFLLGNKIGQIGAEAVS